MAKKAKTEKFHTEAEEAVYTLLKDVVDKHHNHFEKPRFLILFKHGGWSSKGRNVFAKFKVLADDLRRTLKKEAILYLNCDAWRKMTEPQQRYFLDEALFGLDFKTNAKGDILIHADGSPLLKSVPPDLEAYIDVIKRHGPIAADVKRLLLGLKEVGQMTIEDLKEEPPAPPHEGIKVVVGANGVVEEVEDKNQLTIEGVAAAAEAANNDPMHDVDKGTKTDEPEDDNLE
ncbi:putative metallopeptidase [Paenibacillus sinopodophylli]|uniref:putative metallopeptidase n=1 Tax=Paenibacillus sinopodophylli TaxID=1837342 RepID=UPI00110D1982|nr:putative metallopeptidase [Paenibacillus sinopodophylli]